MSELFDRAKTKWLSYQQLTYWQKTSMTYSGDVGYAAPVLVNCRWNNVAEIVKDSEGREKVSKAMIHPETEIPVESYVALGDYTGTPDPDSLDTDIVFEIIKIGNFKGVHQDSEMYTIWV